MSELKIIEAKLTLFSGAPISYLQEALYYWICHHSNSTLKTVCETLKSDVVGEENLGKQFEQRFWEHRGWLVLLLLNINYF